MNNANDTIGNKTQRFENVAVYVKGGLGSPIRINCKFVEVTTGVKYAQHTDAVSITFLEKGKRKTRGAVYGYQPFVVVTSLDAPAPADMFAPAEVCEATGVSFSKSRYTSFDPRYQSDFMETLATRGAAVYLAIA